MYKRQLFERTYLLYALCTLAALLLYMWSNSLTVEDHAAAAEVGLFTQLTQTPGFFVRFILISFSSMVVGIEEAIAAFTGNIVPFAVMGLLVIAAYLYALYLNCLLYTSDLPFKAVILYTDLLSIFIHLGNRCFSEMKEAAADPCNAKTTELIAEACFFIARNCTEPLELETVAKHCLLYTSRCV